MKSVLVTGYRAHELGIFDQKHPGVPFIKQAIADRLKRLADQGLEWVVSPGQYGTDLWACEAAYTVKEHYPQLKVAIVTAYANQDAEWKEEKKLYYEQVLEQADYVGSVSNQGYEGVWQMTARDDLLLRRTDGIILFYDEDSGEASPRFMKKRALKKHQDGSYELLIITAEDVQSLSEEAAWQQNMDS